MSGALHILADEEGVSLMIGWRRVVVKGSVKRSVKESVKRSVKRVKSVRSVKRVKRVKEGVKRSV